MVEMAFKVNPGTTFYKNYFATKEKKIMSTTNNMNTRLFIDMDGTLAVWKQAACFEDLLQPGYFRDLPPYPPLERGFGLSKWMTSRHHLLVQKVRLLVSMIPAAS